MLVKILWVIRAFCYKVFLKKVEMPSYMGRPISIYGSKKISIGKKVRIFPGIRLEAHMDGEIAIEDNVAIGQNVHITSAGNLIIKKNTTILGSVFITNIDHDYQELGKHILEQKYIIRETVIGENCFIGYGAAIQAGTKLGKQCVVGANSVVRGEFPDYCVIAGVPARVIKKYDFKTKSWERVK